MSLVERGYVVLDTWCSRSEQALTDARKEFMETGDLFPRVFCARAGAGVRHGRALRRWETQHRSTTCFVRRMRQWCMAEVIDSGVLAPYLRERLQAGADCRPYDAEA
jgi:hypothetical protein